jgi:FkbM family methyltransferase
VSAASGEVAAVRPWDAPFPDGPRPRALGRALEWLALTVRILRRQVVEHAGVRLRLAPHLSRRVARAILRGEYERLEQHIISRTLDPDDIVLELGAGIGYISALCAKRIGSHRVFAFEANPALEPHIRATYRLNEVAPTLLMGMLGPRATTQTLHLMKHFWSSSAIPRHGSTRTVAVPVHDCGAEVRRIAPTYLIVDIEGGERDLLEHIDLSTVRKIAVELHERVIGASAVAETRARLTAAGFRVVPELSSGEQLFLVRE